jgi:hypothetical protein
LWCIEENYNSMHHQYPEKNQFSVISDYFR